MVNYITKLLAAVLFVLVVLLAVIVSYLSYTDDESRAVRMCSSLKYVNNTHTLFFPALGSDLMAMASEGNVRIDEIYYAGVDQIVGKFGQFVARCDYHVRKCRLLSAVYSGETNSSDFLCSDLSMLVGAKESEVSKWRQGLV